MAGIGINHQSNGRSDPLSRSWNRVIVQRRPGPRQLGADRCARGGAVDDGNDDDNPDIEDYIGRGDATLVHSAAATSSR